MATARKDQPWGVRTVYRNGRSILVGPYKGRRAAVLALLTGNGQVLSSDPVYLGLGLRESTGPVRILREKRVSFGQEVVEPSYSFSSTGENFELLIGGPDLDQVQSIEVTYDDGQGPQTLLIEQADFLAQSSTSILLSNPALGNTTVTRVRMFAAPAGASQISDDQNLAVPIPGEAVTLDYALAYGPTAVQIGGSGLDQVAGFQFFLAPGGEGGIGPFLIRFVDYPSYFIQRTSGLVQINVPGWEDTEFQSMSLLDEDDNTIALVNVDHGVFPRVDVIDSPAVNTFHMAGTRLADGINILIVSTDQGDFTYYNPAGPQAASNSLTVTIPMWSNADISIDDPALAGAVVETVLGIREQVATPSVDEDPVDFPISEGNYDVDDVVYSQGQGYQVDVTGVDLDLVNRFLFNLTGGGQIAIDRDDLPGAFTTITPTLVSIFTVAFGGEELTGVYLLDANGETLGPYAQYSFTPISFPGPSDVASLNPNQFEVNGTRLPIGTDSIEVVTDQGVFTYYDPSGPNNGLNPGTSFIDNWASTVIRITDTQFEALAPVTINHIDFHRLDGSTSAFIEDTDEVIMVTSNVTITSVSASPSVRDGVDIFGTDLDQVVAFRVGVEGENTGLLSLFLPGDLAQFDKVTATQITFHAAVLPGNEVTQLDVEDGASAPLAPTFDVVPDLPFPELDSASSPARATLRVDGKLLTGVDRLVLDTGSVEYYNPAGPNAGLNGPGVTFAAWADDHITVTDTQGYFFQPLNVGFIEAYREGITEIVEDDLLVNVNVLPQPAASQVIPVDYADVSAVMEIDGEYLDTVEEFRFAATGEQSTISITHSGNPSAFVAYSANLVQIQSGLFHGSTITSLGLYDGLGTLLATIDVNPDISTADIDVVTSPAPETVRIEGTMFDSISYIELGTSFASIPYYDPNGPNAGSNPAGSVITEWSDTVIEVQDPQFTLNRPVSVTYAQPHRPSNTTQYIFNVDPAVDVEAAPNTMTITSVAQTSPSVNDGPAAIIILGTHLDEADAVDLVTSGDETSLSFTTPDFSFQDASTITIASTDFPGVAIEQVTVDDTDGNAVTATANPSPAVQIPEVTSITSPAANRVRVEGKEFGAVDTFLHFAEAVPNNNGFQVYDPAGPNAGSNGGTITVIEFSDTVIEFIDTRFTDESRLTIEHYFLNDETNSPLWENTLSPALAVTALVAGPITDMQNLATDEHGLALLGTGLDVYNSIEVQACGNAFTFTYDLNGGSPEVQSVAPTEVDVIDPLWAGNVIARASADGNTPVDDAVVFPTIQDVQVYTRDTLYVAGERIADDEVNSYRAALGVSGTFSPDDLVDGFVVTTTEVGDRYYFRSDGPNAGSNPVGATVTFDPNIAGSGAWLIKDPAFTSAGPYEVTQIKMQRGNFTPAASRQTSDSAFMEITGGNVGGELPDITSFDGSFGNYLLTGQFLDVASTIRFQTDGGVGPDIDVDLTAPPVGVNVQSPSNIYFGVEFAPLIGHTITAIDMLDGADAPLVPQFTGTNLPIVVPPINVDHIDHQGSTDFLVEGEIIAALSLEGTYLGAVDHAVFTTTGDETSVTVPVMEGYAGYGSVTLFSADLLGTTVESVEIFDDANVSLGVFDVADVVFPEVDSYTSPASKTVEVTGKLFGVIDQVGLQLTDATSTAFGSVTYYDPAGPNAGSNPVGVTFGAWTATDISITDPDIFTNNPGCDRVDSLQLVRVDSVQVYSIGQDLIITP